MNYDVVVIKNPGQLQQLHTKPVEVLRGIRRKHCTYNPAEDSASSVIKSTFPHVATDLAYDDALRMLTRLHRQHGSRIMLLVFDNPEDNKGVDCELYVRAQNDQWKYRPCPASRVGNTLDVPVMTEWEWAELVKIEAHRAAASDTVCRPISLAKPASDPKLAAKLSSLSP